MLPLATTTQQQSNRRVALAYVGDRSDHSFARHLDGADQQRGAMGAELSKRKHKSKRVDKETWTGQNGEAQGPEADLKVADKANQCVLQWIQSITADG